MISEAGDFLTESDALYNLIKAESDCTLQEVTAFKA